MISFLMAKDFHHPEPLLILSLCYNHFPKVILSCLKNFNIQHDALYISYGSTIRNELYLLIALRVKIIYRNSPENGIGNCHTLQAHLIQENMVEHT